MGSARKISENQRKNNQAIMEQVGKQKTRDRVGGSKRVIGEQFLGGERAIKDCVLRSEQLGRKGLGAWLHDSGS